MRACFYIINIYYIILYIYIYIYIYVCVCVCVSVGERGWVYIISTL